MPCFRAGGYTWRCCVPQRRQSDKAGNGTRPAGSPARRAAALRVLPEKPNKRQQRNRAEGISLSFVEERPPSHLPAFPSRGSSADGCDEGETPRLRRESGSPSAWARSSYGDPGSDTYGKASRGGDTADEWSPSDVTLSSALECKLHSTRWADLLDADPYGGHDALARTLGTRHPCTSPSAVPPQS